MAADDVPAFDDLPSFDAMSDAPEASPPERSTMRFDDLPSFDEMPHDQPKAEGGLKTFGREAAHSVLPGLAGVAGAAGAGALAGTLMGGPPGTVAGLLIGAGGALAGGYAGSKVQEAALDELGLDDSQQRAANLEANPKSAIAGQVAGSMVGMSPSAGASVAERLLGGGIMGGITAGQELATEGKVNPTELAMSTAAGAIAPRFNRLGQKVSDLAEGAVAHVAGRPNKAPNPAAAPVQDEAASSQQATVAGENSLQQPPPQVEGDTIGTPQSAPTRSERVYGKGQRPADYQNDMLSQGEMTPDVAAALKSSVEQSAVGDYSAEPRPAVPEPKPQQPNIDQSLKEAPVPTGIEEAAGVPPAEQGGPPGERPAPNPETENVTKEDFGWSGPADPTKPSSLVFDNIKSEHPADRVTESAKEATGHEATPGQKTAENYKMGHDRLFGRQVSLENARGTTREAADKSWKTENLPYDYGKFLGTKGADGDHIDYIHVGTGDRHFVVDQVNADTGKFDEHKVIGYAKDAADALDHYARGFSDNKGMDRAGSIKEVSEPDLKQWLATPGKKKTPFDPNFKERGAVPTEGEKPLPKVVTAAVTKMKAAGLPQAAIDKFMAMEPSKRIGEASKYVNETRDVAARPDRIRGVAPKVEGLEGVTGRSKADVEGMGQNVKKLNDAFEATKPVEGESKEDTINRARKFLEGAKDAGFIRKGSNKPYRPAAVDHAATAYEKAVRKLLTAKNPTQKSVDAFKAQELLLRSGNAEDVKTARQTGRIESDIGLSRRSGDDAIANAEAKSFEVPHEEAETMVEPEPAVTKEDVQKLSPKSGEIDISSKPDRVKLQADTAKVVENLIKQERKAPVGESEGAASGVRKIALDSVDMKALLERVNKAQKKANDTGAVREEELGKFEPEQPKRQLLTDFFKDERGSLDFNKITQDFRAKITPAFKYWSRMFGTPLNDRARRADATLAQVMSTEDARLADKARQLFDARYYQWIDKASKPEAMTYLKTIEKPGNKTAPEIERELIAAGIAPEKAAWMKDEALFHRELMDKVWQEDKLRGSDQDYIENYVPHIFDKGEVDGMTAEQFIERRIQNLGPTWYQKERVFDLLDAAIKAGFKPKFDNPIDLLNARWAASIRSNTIVDAARALNKDGLAFNLNELPPDYEAIKKAWPFQRRLPDGNTWAFAPDAEHFWKNSVEAKGLNENQGTPGSIYRAWMGVKRVVVPIQLALSAFHALHVVGNIAVAQNLHTAIERSLATGNWKENLVQAGKDIAKDTVFSLPMMFPGVNSLVKDRAFFKEYAGRQMQEIWRTPDDQLNGTDLMWKRLFQEAGASPYQSREDVIGAKRAFAQAIADYGNAANKVGPGMKVALKGIQRGMEKLQEPLFKDTIPALKNMALMRAISAAVEKEPNLVNSPDMRKQVLREIGKDIDDRFGEMFYKNLFWNKTLKDIGIGSMLSLSWNLGQVRQVAGAGREGIQKIGRLISGDQRQPIERARQDASNKIGFVTSYVGLSMATAGALSYTLSGIVPTGLDYVFPRNGHTNPEDGSPQRLTSPFNTREAVMLKAHADEKNSLIGGLATLIWNKTVLQPVVELATNKDFFGRKLYDTNAPWWKAALQGVDSTLGRTFNPISITGASRAKELGGGKAGQALSFLGFGPAPKYVNETPLERRINHLYTEEGTTASKPYQYGEKTGLGRGLVQDTIRGIAGDKLQAEELQDARHRLALGDPDARRDLIEKGKLDKNTVRRMMPGTEFEHKFSRLPIDTQLALVPEMSKEEFSRFVMNNRLISRNHMAQIIKARGTNP